MVFATKCQLMADLPLTGRLGLLHGGPASHREALPLNGRQVLSLGGWASHREALAGWPGAYRKAGPRLLFFGEVLKMLGLVQIIMPLHTRKLYPNPWLQHTRGSDGERSPKMSQTWGENAVEKKQSPLSVDSFFFCFFPELEKNRVYKKWGLCFFPPAFPPHVWDSFFRAEILDSSLFTSWSCMLEPGVWIWHYNLHQSKHFKDFFPKKSNLAGPLIGRQGLSLGDRASDREVGPLKGRPGLS